MTKAKIYREKKREIDVPTSTCRCDLSWHFFKQRESTTFDIRESCAGLLAWNFHNIFTCPNSQDKNLHIQNILVIFEYVWAKILYHYSKSFKHLERDSTNLSTRVEKKKPWQSVVTCHVASQSTFDKGQGWNHLLVLHLEMHRYNPDKIPVVGMNRLVLLHLRETIYTIQVERWTF